MKERKVLMKKLIVLVLVAVIAVVVYAMQGEKKPEGAEFVTLDAEAAKAPKGFVRKVLSAYEEGGSNAVEKYWKQPLYGPDFEKSTRLLSSLRPCCAMELGRITHLKFNAESLLMDAESGGHQLQIALLRQGNVFCMQRITDIQDN